MSYINLSNYLYTSNNKRFPIEDVNHFKIDKGCDGGRFQESNEIFGN